MNLRIIIKYMGLILRMEALFMLPPLVLALVKHEDGSAVGFAVTAALLMAVGTVLSRVRQDDSGVYAKEGFVSVALGWILISLFGALPFYISGCIPEFIDCWFETVSGFTTTGASILPAVEGLPYSILYWRSFTHWLGGMGVLVFLMAIVPLSKGKGGGEGFQLMRAESPGPVVGKLTPTLRNTARILYGIYLIMTVVEVLLLLAGGMPLFDSVVNSFATAGTGGFAIKNTSIAAYTSPYLQLVIAVFMMLFGINFSLYYLVLLRRIRDVFRNEELRVYLGIMGGVTLIIFLSIVRRYESIGKALLDSYFQVSSVMTTTGFATTDFDKWPEISRFLLVSIMIFGACAGSTGGGMKISRLIILVKSANREVMRILRPRTVKIIRADSKPVSEETVRNTNAFFVLYFVICLVSMAVVALDDFNQETTVTSVLACVNNIGPGLSLVGPMGNYALFSPLSKLVLSFDMLFGRLEIFPMIMLFTPSVWLKGRHKKNRVRAMQDS
ncbi:MAG: TrkH family potassium uptake protein [Clostridiales bacterium]|nr:TrkH family potassium uptake protein [Clostridiales bacterium]